MILAILLAAQAPNAALPPWAQPVPAVQNPAVTQDNLQDTVCSKKKDAKGHTWVHDQRPPVSYTNKIKFALMDAAGIPRSDAHLYELDHTWSIEAGGHPRDVHNLRLQPWAGKLNAKTKDVEENRVHADLCTGRITLDEAGKRLASDGWTVGYRLTFGKDPQ